MRKIAYLLKWFIKRKNDHLKLVPVVRTLEKECPSYRFSYILEVMK